MALEAALEKLCNDLQRLQDRLVELEDTFEKFMPEEGGAHLVDDLSDRVTDLRSFFLEALGSAGTARTAEKDVYEQNRMRRALVSSQQGFLGLQKLFYGELLTYEATTELIDFARRAGGDWPGWVQSVFIGLDACRPWLEACTEAYCAAWQEIAERAMTGPVSMHTTNIGQQITASALDAKGAVEAGIT